MNNNDKQYKIVVYHNKIVIHDYQLGDCPALENMFDAYDAGTRMYKTQACLYNRMEMELVIPRGIDIHRLQMLTGYTPYYNTKIYNKPKQNKNQILIKYPPKDEKQELALQFLTGKGEYNYTKASDQLFLALNTGAGKTYLGLVYTALLNVKTIIITTNVGWLNQWKEAILEHTNIVSTEVKLITGSDILTILNDKRNHDNIKIWMVTHASLMSFANEYGWENVDMFFKKIGIGLKIIDEAHLNFDSLYFEDYASSIYKTLYLSATPCRGNAAEDRIYQAYFHSVPMLDLFDNENDPHTHYISLLYKSGMDAYEVNALHTIHGFNKSYYADLLITKDNFDYISRIVMDMISNISGKKIFFFATNNSVLYFYEWLRYNYMELANDIGIYTSINPDKDQAKENTIILTTSKSAGACLDIKDLMVCINMAEPTSSPPQNQQRFGRTRAYNSFYIDVVDMSVKTIMNYYKKSLPMYDKYALDTREVRFTNKQLKDTAFNVMYKRYVVHGRLPFERIDDNGNTVYW